MIPLRRNRCLFSEEERLRDLLQSIIVYQFIKRFRLELQNRFFMKASRLTVILYFVVHVLGYHHHYHTRPFLFSFLCREPEVLDVLLAVRPLYALPIPDYVDQLARGILNISDRPLFSILVMRAEIAQARVELLLRHPQDAKTRIRIVQRTRHLGHAEAVSAASQRPRVAERYPMFFPDGEAKPGITDLDFLDFLDAAENNFVVIALVLKREMRLAHDVLDRNVTRVRIFRFPPLTALVQILGLRALQRRAAGRPVVTAPIAVAARGRRERRPGAGSLREIVRIAEGRRRAHVVRAGAASVGTNARIRARALEVRRPPVPFIAGFVRRPARRGVIPRSAPEAHRAVPLAVVVVLGRVEGVHVVGRITIGLRIVVFTTISEVNSSCWVIGVVLGDARKRSVLPKEFMSGETAESKDAQDSHPLTLKLKLRTHSMASSLL